MVSNDIMGQFPEEVTPGALSKIKKVSAGIHYSGIFAQTDEDIGVIVKAAFEYVDAIRKNDPLKVIDCLTKNKESYVDGNTFSELGGLSIKTKTIEKGKILNIVWGGIYPVEPDCLKTEFPRGADYLRITYYLLPSEGRCYYKVNIGNMFLEVPINGEVIADLRDWEPNKDTTTGSIAQIRFPINENQLYLDDVECRIQGVCIETRPGDFNSSRLAYNEGRLYFSKASQEPHYLAMSITPIFGPIVNIETQDKLLEATRIISHKIELNVTGI